MGIADLLDEIANASASRPRVDKVIEPPPQAPESRPCLSRAPLPGSARSTYQIATKGTTTSRLKGRGTRAGGPQTASSPRGNSNKQAPAVASSRYNSPSGCPTQPRGRAGSGPTRTPRTTSARADPLAKPNRNPGLPSPSFHHPTPSSIPLHHSLVVLGLHLASYHLPLAFFFADFLLASPSDRRSPATSQPPVRKQQTTKPAKPREPTDSTATKKPTTASSSRAAAPSIKAESKQPLQPVDGPVTPPDDPDTTDCESLFGDSVLESIKERPKPARFRRGKGSQLKKIIGQTKREATFRRQAQAQLQAEAAKRAAEKAKEAEIEAERRAKSAKSAGAAREARQLAARSLLSPSLSPSLTPTVIPAGAKQKLIGEVKLNNDSPLLTLLATSKDADMDPPKHGNYPIILSDALLGKASKETVSGIRYNHKPALSSDIAPSQSRLKRSAKDGSYNLGFDDNGDKYQYNGVRTAADGQYVLVFDPDRKAFVLHQVDSMFNMNIAKTPTDTNAAKQFPPLDVKGTVLDKPAPKQKASTAASKNKEAPAKNAPAGRGRGGKSAQNKQNPATLPPSKPASPPRADAEGHATKHRKPTSADSEDEDEDDDDGGLTIEYPDGPPPERFKPAVNKYASPALALTRRFSEFAAAYNPDEEEDVNMDAEFESRFNEDADGEGGGYEDDDEEEEENEDMVDALALPSPINKPAALARTNSYHENPLPPPDRFSFDDGSDMEAEFENVQESAPVNNQANAADGIDDAEIAAMEAELAKDMESDVSEEE
ncbi:RNA polymerase II transcription elongation factor-domain-containing protein [Neurospora hispaniola]|uniref:RNA polymerase II transcription elongation factor-domain-containing protein n=1 Tax=Neurospora hispaniola TaxID=588809 RepID=A0AAJ0I3T4_9PEZI|nr:RNA polymerase II transcription elongation factor-domain-containing protein [Neurospora hispaniola]